MKIKVHMPREIAFSVRNRLNVLRIPYKEVKIEEIEVDLGDYGAVLKILQEFGDIT